MSRFTSKTASIGTDITVIIIGIALIALNGWRGVLIVSVALLIGWVLNMWQTGTFLKIKLLLVLLWEKYAPGRTR